MSKRGAQAQRKEQKRLRRALRRTNRLPKGLPGSGSKKRMRRFFPDPE
jgi:hypothetical protein